MTTQDKVLKLTEETWTEFLNIHESEMHPDDTNEFRFHIHALQNILMSQLYHIGELDKRHNKIQEVELSKTQEL